MKIKMLTIYTRIISFFLVLLGFSSCDGIGPDPVDEYGVPSAKFKVNGKIADAESEEEKAVKGIKVVIGQAYENETSKHVHYIDSVLTDKDGKFDLSVIEFPTSQKFILKIEDIDGVENGLYETKTEDVEFSDPTFQNGSGNWYEGEATKDVGTLKITPANPEEE